MAERKNRTVTEMVNAMLDTAGMSWEWWGEAVLTTCHTLKRGPMKNQELTLIFAYVGLFSKGERTNC